MYFPSDMTFQYFFFDTLPGYFLQVLPLALAAGILCWVNRWKRFRRPAWWRVTLAALFVAYIAALVQLTLVLEFISDGYYLAFYHRLSMRDHRWFTLDSNLSLTFYRRFGWEELWNILMFVPFGILYPFFRQGSRWLRTLLAGGATVLILELLQPVFGRAFDLNDVVLNIAGVAASTLVYYLIHGLIVLLRRKVRAHKRKKAET